MTDPRRRHPPPGRADQGTLRIVMGRCTDTTRIGELLHSRPDAPSESLHGGPLGAHRTGHELRPDAPAVSPGSVWSPRRPPGLGMDAPAVSLMPTTPVVPPSTIVP